MFCEEQTGGEGPECKQEIIEVIQVRDDSCLNWDIGSRSDKKGSESGCILKVEFVRFPNGLDVKCEKKGEVKNDSKVSCLSNWKDGTTITYVWEGQVLGKRPNVQHVYLKYL